MSYEQLIQLAIEAEENRNELYPAWDEPELDALIARNSQASIVDSE